jgi:hypothetical protein
VSKKKKVTLKGKPAGSEARLIWLAFQDSAGHRKGALIQAWKERTHE